MELPLADVVHATFASPPWCSPQSYQTHPPSLPLLSAHGLDGRCGVLARLSWICWRASAEIHTTYIPSSHIRTSGEICPPCPLSAARRPVNEARADLVSCEACRLGSKRGLWESVAPGCRPSPPTTKAFIHCFDSSRPGTNAEEEVADGERERERHAEYERATRWSLSATTTSAYLSPTQSAGAGPRLVGV
ncbi:hypothetical protein BGZ61DRAFT_239645 [Ilyonectria robusta]|uniref:uncharacterized protein n=1 Tax=Ilyonectria robusta TaxID=1079257 RepID=UPI001E8CA850|nr:uncharacterized protein BGZ61DRAFT_239645 [Ilyonectria robusta]KAH8699918.1 hypothetical protein BGZ61DRAFT_239645 [Ilyonectria robusta]